MVEQKGLSRGLHPGYQGDIVRAEKRLESIIESQTDGRSSQWAHSVTAIKDHQAKGVDFGKPMLVVGVGSEFDLDASPFKKIRDSILGFRVHYLKPRTKPESFETAMAKLAAVALPEESNEETQGVFSVQSILQLDSRFLEDAVADTSECIFQVLAVDGTEFSDDFRSACITAAEPFSVTFIAEGDILVLHDNSGPALGVTAETALRTPEVPRARGASLA